MLSVNRGLGTAAGPSPDVRNYPSLGLFSLYRKLQHGHINSSISQNSLFVLLDLFSWQLSSVLQIEQLCFSWVMCKIQAPACCVFLKQATPCFFRESSPVRLSFNPLPNFEMLHCAPGPLFPFPQGRQDQTVGCWGGDSFSLVLIWPVQPRETECLCLMKQELCGSSSFIPENWCWKSLWSREGSSLECWECCCILLAAGVGHPRLDVPSAVPMEVQKNPGLESLGKQQQQGTLYLQCHELIPMSPGVFLKKCSHGAEKDVFSCFPL